jgi:hypothetical protein
VKREITAMQEELLAAVGDLGGMGTNLAEAKDWANDDRDEEARLSLEAVTAGADDVLQRLRTITLKCEELCAAKAAKGKAGK